jgi:hypothetical protein
VAGAPAAAKPAIEAEGLYERLHREYERARSLTEWTEQIMRGRDRRTVRGWSE